MNLLLLAPEELRNNSVTLRDHRARHIRKVLRARTGDTLRVGLLNGPVGSGVITALTSDEATLLIDLNGEPPPAPLTELILALPRPIMLKRVLAQAASLGVARIFLINANRVEKSFFNASLVKNRDYDAALIRGLEQAIDTRMPAISVHRGFRDFVEGLLPEIAQGCPVRLVAHPNAGKNLWQAAPPPVASRALLAIGPEGGWIDYETEKFIQHGFTCFTLGPRILRVDTAVPALLGQLLLLRQTSIPPAG